MTLKLGCPMWGYGDWVGSFYTPDAKPADYLGQYASVFNTVEGNTTFYSLPSADLVARWLAATPDTFHFCFKFPRVITHERGLVGVDGEVREFIDRLEPLADRLGPLMVQLPPSFGPDRMERLDRFLSDLPGDLPIAVEVRHRGFFDSADACRRLDELLEVRGCGRIVLDTRALRSGPAGHPDVVAARHQKPDLPVRLETVGSQPLVRFVGHPDPEVNAPWLELLVETTSGWLREGRTPYVMMHVPNNLHAPPLARRFHAKLRENLGDISGPVGELPVFPSERADDQLRLF
jgi:uncharacterized protein YecE (DUF72 family)